MAHLALSVLIFVSFPRQQNCRSISSDVPFISWLIRDGRGQVVTPAVPVNNSKPTLTAPALFKGDDVGGRVGEEGQSLRSTTNRIKHNVPFSPWLASRWWRLRNTVKMPDVCSRLIKRKIWLSDNQPAGNVSLYSPREHHKLSLFRICFKPLQVPEWLKRHPY